MSEHSWRDHSQTADVVTLLDSLSNSERFSQIVQGFPLRSAWQPSHPTVFDEKAESPEEQTFIRGLQIPIVENLEFPSLLLHRLGSFKAAEELKMRKEDIFSGKNTFVVNTSGSGKTRLLFEGLCDDWGLYFTSNVDSGFLGSFDVQINMVERLPRKSGFVLFPSLLSEPEAAQASALNAQYARGFSSRILLSRLLVFKLFLDRAIALGGVTQETRKFWLHFQLRPDIQVERRPTESDVFLDVCQSLLDAETDDVVINDAIAQTTKEVLAALGGSTRIFIVLDEANVAVQKCRESFRDDRGGYYPMLKRQYVRQFLPNDIWESIGERLTLRLWKWMRGRHRFTSAYIAILLEHSYAKPFAYLNMVIHQGTGYFPCDVHYDVRPPTDIIPLAMLDFSTLSIDRKLRSYVHLALLDTLVSLTNPGYSTGALNLVNEGIGRFTDSQCSHIVVDEPLVIARAVTWFSGDEGETPASMLNYQYFIDHLVDPEMAPRHPPAYLAFALALAFCKGRCISDIFALSKPIPKWSRRKADIVIRKQDGDGVVERPVRDVDRIHRTLVTYSTTLADTLSWMRRHHRTPFCIHLTETTATLIFIVKLSNNTRFWAIMRVLHSLADEDVATKIRDTAHDLQAENLFREPASFSFILDTDNPSSDILDTLDSLPSICPQVCPHGVLPVIAVLGKNVQPEVLNESDPSRVALLKLDELSQAMDLVPQGQIAERIIDAITRDPEKPEEEAEEEVEETTTRTKARADKGQASGSNQSRSRRPRGSSVVQHDTQASGPSHATPSGTSRYNLRPRIKSKTR
uniref:Uncharacterized protein n=1 Tax=Moniliophthora roreri TaxID=221103 RepID=A0A0W0F6G7_MONRR